MRLVDCMDAIIDYRGKTPKKTNEGIPLITAKIVKNGRIEDVTEYIAEEDYDSWMTRGIPNAGDVVLTTEAPLGEVAQLDERKIALAQRIITLRGKKNVLDNDFLLYLLQSHDVQHQLDGRGTGSTVKGIKQSELKEVILTFPEFQVQRQIAQHLKNIDNKITLNRQINQTIEHMAQALFKSWFVDFDPVVDNALDAGFFEQDLEFSDELMHRAEARKAVRENADFKPLPEDIRQLFPATFEECSETSLGLDGWVPEGWLETKLSELVDTVSKTYPLKTVDEVIFLNTGDIENGDFLHASYSKVDGLPGQAKKSIRKGDILFSEIRPKNKRFAYVRFESNNYVVSTKLMVLRAKDVFHPLFAYFLLTLNQTTDELQRIAELRSGTFPQITFNELSLIKFVLPSTGEIMERFVSLYLEPFFKKSSSNREENESLVNLRDILLPKLMSGEIQFNENEAEIANAMLL